MAEREEQKAEEERQREFLGAVGRKHASFWLVLTLLLVLADSLYGPPAQFSEALFSGLSAWAAGFVAFPVYRSAAALVRLSFAGGEPLGANLRFHRTLSAGNLAAAAYCAVAAWAGLPFLAFAVLCPLASLFTCRALSQEDQEAP